MRIQRNVFASPEEGDVPQKLVRAAAEARVLCGNLIAGLINLSKNHESPKAATNSPEICLKDAQFLVASARIRSASIINRGARFSKVQAAAAHVTFV